MNDEIRQCQSEVERLNAELAAAQAQRQEVDQFLAATQGTLSTAESARTRATTLTDVQSLSRDIDLANDELASGRQLRANLDKLASNLQTALTHAEQEHHAACERHRHARQQTIMASMGPDLLRPCWQICALEVRGNGQPVGIRAAMSRLFGTLPPPDPAAIERLYAEALRGDE